MNTVYYVTLNFHITSLSSKSLKKFSLIFLQNWRYRERECRRLDRFSVASSAHASHTVSNIEAVIRIRIGSGFRGLLDLDSEFGSGSRGLKKG